MEEDDHAEGETVIAVPSGTTPEVKDELDSEEDMLDVEDGFLDTKEET